MNLIIREIFHSIQGEGRRVGESSIFIRLANCNLNCWFCDTDWSHGDIMSLMEIYQEIEKYKCKWIVWTGGEPTLQLNEKAIEFFKIRGYKQAIETNGTNPVPHGIDYITCSPKREVPLKLLFSNFPFGVHEFRYPVDKDSLPPDISFLPIAENYYISPLFLGDEKIRGELDMDNVELCVNFVKENPDWKFSLQIHKIIAIR